MSWLGQRLGQGLGQNWGWVGGGVRVRVMAG